MPSILAVDDSASMRQMLSCALQAGGHTVIEAVDGVDALEKMALHGIDVVLTDHNMPRMDGLSLTRSLRASARYRDLPVLILTTESSAEVKQLGREAGATGWLLKPFDPPRLLEVIERVTR